MKPVFEDIMNKTNLLDEQVLSMSASITQDLEPYIISEDVLSLNENSTDGEVRNAFGGGTFAISNFLNALMSKRPIVIYGSNSGRYCRIISSEIYTMDDNRTYIRLLLAMNGESSADYGVVCVYARTPVNSNMMLGNFNIVYLWSNV